MKSPGAFITLATDRLQLRQLVFADADEILKLRSDEQVNKYLDRPDTLTRDEATEFIRKAITENWRYWGISSGLTHKK